MTDEFRGKLRTLLTGREGRVPWMYPDDEGNVTLGIGHLLATAGDALALGFPLWVGSPSNGKKATIQQICAAWGYVKQTRKPYRGLVLAESDIDALCDRDIDQKEPVITHTFPGVVFPEPAALAIWDMVFNLGSFHAFPDLVGAINDTPPNWRIAARECLRKESQVGKARNQATQALFLAALGPVPQIPEIPVVNTSTVSA